MTTKRFNIHSDEDNETIWISDVQKHKEIEIQHYYGIATVVKMLNELHENAKYWEQLAEGRLEQINQLKQKINTYNKVNELYKKENIQLKAQLSCKSKSVCIICKHHHLVKTDKEYYISKCKKEHEKCSKEDVKYCEDFEWSKKI